MIRVPDHEVEAALKIVVHADGVWTATERIAMRQALEQFAASQARSRIRIAMNELSDEDRHDIITSYCTGCGSTNTSCFCRRDD